MEKNTQSPFEPKLQAPGAGLPLFQTVFLKLVVGPVLSKIKTPAQNKIEYELLVRKLIGRISQVSEENRKARILVDPLPGLEDSSRFWSLNGVLEHLLIVSKSMEIIILSLSAGKVPPEKADIAKVKPSHMDQDSLTEFSSFAPDLIMRIDEKLKAPGMNFDQKLKYHHPWFGPITAKQWYWLLSAHQGIHYRQAKAIIEKLPLN